MEDHFEATWTAALVLRGFRLAPFIAAHAREVLGPQSLEYVALMVRTARVPGRSLRANCRDHIGWPRSRSELYRRSRNGAERVADALNREGVAVPEYLTGWEG